MTMITTADWLGRFFAVERKPALTTTAFPKGEISLFVLYLFMITEAMSSRYAISVATGFIFHHEKWQLF